MTPLRRRPLALVTAALLALLAIRVTAQAPQTFLSVDEVRPGMVGIGRTVYTGTTLEEFRATIVGVLRNVIGPGRNLILARLEGGPLATTGVIRGMSGSPVYVDGKLTGAVSYALGSFPREPLAGITPIQEMIEDVSAGAPRVADAALALDWPATPARIHAALGEVIRRATSPVASLPLDRDVEAVGPPLIAALAPGLRPIGAAMVVSGLDPSLDPELRAVLQGDDPAAFLQAAAAAASGAGTPGTLRPGDPVGMSLIRGDMDMGATGTVTHVDGNKVYGFGHPFLNLGSTSFAMTQSSVVTVLPSLDSSMKIATLGPVIGTMGQDRATAVGGTLGAAPRELEVNLRLSSARTPDREFKFFVLHDPQLTPLFAYVAVLNTLVSYQRQAGMLSIEANGTLSFGTNGTMTIDDFFAGDTAVTAAAAALTAPIGIAVTNEFRAALPERLDLRLEVSETRESATIERAWLDTVHPVAGSTHTLNVLLRNYRGATETLQIPITMPVQAQGPVKILVSDGAHLAELEERELKPADPANWPSLLERLRAKPRNNRVYVRVITSSPGTAVGGDTLPALPQSVRTVFGADATTPSAPVSSTVVGAWEHRLEKAIQGWRELSVTLSPRRD
jgi:hypothetical protein